MTTAPSTNWRSLHGEHFEHRRVLITGGAGFIGSHLASALWKLGADVIVLDDLSGGSRDNLRELGNLEFIQGSITDPAVVSKSVRGCRCVFHQAALGSVPRSVEQPRLYHDVNVTGTLNVLQAAREAKVDRVLFATSSSAYGENPVPWIESMPTLPRSPYAATKVACESLVRAFAASYGLDGANLRYFNIFGPRQNANSAYAAVIAAFAKAMLAGQHPTIFGDGEQSRDFTYIDNVVHANLLAARNPQPLRGEVINVGCGGRISVNDLAETMATALNRPDLTPRHEPERTGDIKHSFADLQRARSLLSYEPVVDFATGLRATIDWYRSMLA